MDSHSVPPTLLPNGDQPTNGTVGTHEHGISINQLIDPPVATSSSYPPIESEGLKGGGGGSGSGMGGGTGTGGEGLMNVESVARSENGLRALADAVMGGGGAGSTGSGVGGDGEVVVDTLVKDTEIQVQQLEAQLPQPQQPPPPPQLDSQSTPTLTPPTIPQPTPAAASSYDPAQPNHSQPPLLNPLQTTGPPPSSIIVEPSRSPGGLVVRAEEQVRGGNAFDSSVDGERGDVVMGDGDGDGMTTAAAAATTTTTEETRINSGPLPTVDGNNQIESNGKRSMDDLQVGDEERYMKRARESVDEPSSSIVHTSSQPPSSASQHTDLPRPVESQPPSAVVPPHAPAPPAPAPTPTAPPPHPSFPPPLPGQYIPGTYIPPIRPNRGFNMPMTMSQYKVMINIIRSLKKSKEALAFLHPVDAIALGIPHYPQVIKRPMDLTTVEIKLYASNPAGPPKDKSKAQKWDTSKGTYLNVDEVIQDVRQIWDNCAIFNGPTHNISTMAKNLDDSFEKSVEKVPRDDVIPTTYASASSPSNAQRPRSGSISQMPTIRRNSSIDLIGGGEVRPKREIHPPTPKDAVWEQSETQGKKSRKRPDAQMKWALGAVSEMMSPKYADCNLAFLEPVNPTLLNIPDYFQVVKKPMDLSTIKHKLTNNDYNEVAEVNKDMKQMFANCYTYNPPNTPVNMAGKKLESIWQAKWKMLPAKEVKEESEGGSVYDEEVFAEEDAEINTILGQIADLQHRLDVLRKTKARKQKSKTSKPSTTKATTYSTPASKPPKASKNGAVKPKKASNGVNGSKKQRRESAMIYADDDGDGDSDGGDVVEQVTLAQKQELADKIQEAGVDVLNQAIQIIQETTTSLGDNGEEIELDIDALPAATVVRLYNLVVKGITKPLKPASKKPGRKSGPQPHGGNRKKVNDAHEAERIRRMEQQLASFHGAGAGAGGGGGGGDDDGEEDDVDSQTDSEDDE